MQKIMQGSHCRTSAQIALEDKVFYELFGMIWTNSGYNIDSEEDLSWAILYKDMFLQGLADYANEGFVSVLKGQHYLVHESAKRWVETTSPFNTDEIESVSKEVNDIIKRFYDTKQPAWKRKVFDKKVDEIVDRLESSDPFSFDKCCKVLGLKPEEARTRFKLYRHLKQKHGHEIRIVTYTGNKKNLNIPSLEDIIYEEETNGKHDLPLFLHVGIKRELRDRALVRSKNERTDEGNSEQYTTGGDSKEA